MRDEGQDEVGRVASCPLKFIGLGAGWYLAKLKAD